MIVVILVGKAKGLEAQKRQPHFICRPHPGVNFFPFPEPIRASSVSLNLQAIPPGFKKGRGSIPAVKGQRIRGIIFRGDLGKP
jgi:hypothetical protein